MSKTVYLRITFERSEKIKGIMSKEYIYTLFMIY